MTLPKLAVKRPVAMLMCVLCLIVFGVSSVFNMEMESTPMILASSSTEWLLAMSLLGSSMSVP